VAITSGVWPDPQTSIEPVAFGVGSNIMTLLTTYHLHGKQKHPTLAWVKELFEHPEEVLGSLDARHWSERMIVLLAMQTTDTSIELYWKDGMLRSRQGSGTPPSVHIPVVEQFADRLAKKIRAEQRALDFETINRTASAHFIGGIPIGEDPTRGAVDPYQRAFGQPGLHVMDGSVMPANPGVNPSLMISAFAERAMAFWPNKGDVDPRPALGSPYRRLAPVMPRHPSVPAGAPGALRLEARKEDVVPEYPY
jgi:cholesterol oxidase